MCLSQGWSALAQRQEQGCATHSHTQKIPSEQEPEPSQKEECWKELSFISSLLGRGLAASAQQIFLPAFIAERWDGSVQEHPNDLETGGSLSEQCGYCKRRQMYRVATASTERTQLCLVLWAGNYLCTERPKKD